MDIGRRLDQRYRLSMAEYDEILSGGGVVRFGTRNATLAERYTPAPTDGQGATLFLRRIQDYHREYAWAA